MEQQIHRAVQILQRSVLPEITKKDAAEYQVNEFYANELFYANDLLKSLITTEEAVNLAKEITEVMQCGGFRLTRFILNDMNSIPVTERVKLF